MIRVLLVEDVPDTATILRDVILLKFPLWSVEIAATVPRALSLIESESDAFDFAVLDFFLPTKDGITQGDLSICAAIRTRRLRTRVIHITAQSTDEALRQHIQDVHLDSFDSDYSVKKDTTDWMEKVVDRLRAFFHSDRIEDKLEDLFPERGRSHDPRQHLRSHNFGGSVTNRLTDLCADARIHWNFLREVTRQHLKKHLFINDSDPRDVRVSLIGEIHSVMGEVRSE